MSRLSANLLLLLAGATWGMGFVAQSTAMQSIGPLTFIAARFLIATLAVLPFALCETRRSARAPESIASSGTDRGLFGLRRGEWFGFALIGACLFTGMTTQQYGLLTTTVTNSGFLTGLYVVFTPLLAVLLFRDRPHRVVWLAASIALAGIYLLSGSALGGFVIGDALTLASALFWALQVLLIARLVGRSGRPLALAATQFAVTALLALSGAWLIETTHWDALRAALPEILYTGLVASGFAFTLQVIGQRYTTAPQAAIFLASEAPFAALFGYLFLGERLGLAGLIGCVMILTAMLLVEVIPAAESRRRLAREHSNPG